LLQKLATHWELLAPHPASNANCEGSNGAKSRGPRPAAARGSRQHMAATNGADACTLLAEFPQPTEPTMCTSNHGTHTFTVLKWPSVSV